MKVCITTILWTNIPFSATTVGVVLCTLDVGGSATCDDGGTSCDEGGTPCGGSGSTKTSAIG